VKGVEAAGCWWGCGGGQPLVAGVGLWVNGWNSRGFLTLSLRKTCGYRWAWVEKWVSD